MLAKQFIDDWKCCGKLKIEGYLKEWKDVDGRERNMNRNQ